jgi:hypothetical protein
MARSSTSLAPHLPSWEFTPKPLDCDVLGLAKTDDLEMADDTFGFDLLLARFRKQRLQRALRQDTVSPSATPTMAGPSLFRSSHSALDLAGGGTTRLTPTSLRFDKTKDGDVDVTPAPAPVLGLAGDGATPMATTSTRVDKTVFLVACDRVVSARVLGLAGDGHRPLGHRVDADGQDLPHRRAGCSRAPRARSPREMAILVKTLAPSRRHHPGWHHPVSALDGGVFAGGASFPLGHDLVASRQDRTISMAATAPHRPLGSPLAQNSRVSSRQQPFDGTHGGAHKLGSPQSTTALARGGHDPKRPETSQIRRDGRPGDRQDGSTGDGEEKESERPVPSGQGRKRRRFSSSNSPERESSPMTLKTPWSPTEPAAGAVRPRSSTRSVELDASSHDGGAAGPSPGLIARGAPVSLRRKVKFGPAAHRPVGQTRGPPSVPAVWPQISRDRERGRTR